MSEGRLLLVSLCCLWGGGQSPAHREDWVRNGASWTIKDVCDEGSITIRKTGRRFGGPILPAAYVAEDVELG